MKKYIVRVTEKNYGYAIIIAENKDEAEERALDYYNEEKFTWENSSLGEFVAEEYIRELVCGGCTNLVNEDDLYYEIPNGEIICQSCITKMDTHDLLCFLGCKGVTAGEEGE